MITTLLAFGIVAQTAPDYTTGPVFTVAKTLVGKWEGTVDGKALVKMHFTLEQGGKLIVAKGSVTPTGKAPLPIRSSLGWDAAAKQIYYLDQHGHDTVYYGHVTMEGDEIVFDFRGLSGDPGHYQSRLRVGKNEYSSTMAGETDGKWKDYGVHLVLKRVK